MEISTSLVAAMAEPLPPDDEELASVSGSIADDNQGAFQDVVRGTKRRCPSQASGSSEKTIITQTEPTVGLVVLFTPVDGDVRIDSINSVRLTSTLETLVPSCVIEVRYNRRKNLLAIDTRNGQTTPEAGTEMVVLTENLQRRRRHSRRRQAEQPVAEKQDPSSSLVAEAPKPMDTEPPPKEAPVFVSSGENIGRQSYKAALQNKPPSSSPPVQAGPAPYYACTGRLTFPAFFMRRHICRLRDLYGISWNDATEPEYEWLLAFPLDSPWSKHPFTIYEDIPSFHGKSRHPSVVSRALTEEVMTSRPSSFTAIYTDGSVDFIHDVASAAYHIPSEPCSWSARFDHAVSSTTAELTTLTRGWLSRLGYNTSIPFPVWRLMNLLLQLVRVA
ncbi:hypothetical protein HPB47_004646 [Ixodes persulcatus]|uniref:Uncharacterized protein n=1 Tax=Ixodes persulcatus TaxID=34615 RepID=A0AC60PF48_IXOPE|nr:hypothetical protein HPB47_004646 [Ixodes persulcatus]